MANEIWASNANYPLDGKPWAGTPLKVAPSVGAIAAGHTPGVPVPAEIENWWKNRTDTRLVTLEGLLASKWKWIAGNTLRNPNQYATLASASSHGLFGTAGQTATASVEIDLPVGARLLSLGLVVKHVAGESNGGVIGGASILRLPNPANGASGNNTASVIQADPPATIPVANTLEVMGNNAAGALWETIVVDIDQTQTFSVALEDGVAYFINVFVNGALQIATVGYEYAP